MEIRITLSQEFFLVSTESGTVAVPITGSRASALANAVLALPAIAQQLVSAGVTRVVLAGRADGGRLPAAVWALMVPKGDEELERSRQEALRILADAGVAIDADVTIVPAEKLADALAKNASAGAGAFAE